MKNKDHSDIDAEHILSTCYKCEAVPEKSCAECGNLFCSNHGGDRYIMRGGNKLIKRMVCDDCTPNQTIMKMKRNILVIFAILVFLFIATMVIYLFFYADHSVSRPTPSEPAPVESVEPVEDEFSE